MYPFHMPGHKRQLGGSYEIDMTEVEGVDDLHDPTDVIAYEQQRLAKLYRAKHSYMLVGGSTVGNLSAIYATCNEGDLILIQRNSHKSVYNGVTLRHLRTGYIFPKLSDDGIYQAVTMEDIATAVKRYGRPKAMVLTSPTYEGYLADIEAISSYCKNNDIILIIDGAHGAHLGFDDNFPGATVEMADITIMSLHKTLPSLTQTAALHISGDRVSGQKIREALDIFETSSPSYVLMNSISECLDVLEGSGDYFARYVDNLKRFYRASGQLKHLLVIDESATVKDMGKIVISTKDTNISGVELARLLREDYEIETELSSFSYVLAMTSIMDTAEGFDRLIEALVEIDSKLEAGDNSRLFVTFSPVKKMELWEAKAGEERVIPLEDSKGMCCASIVCLYPPGAPVIVPGEVISSETIEQIGKAKAAGIHVTGLINGGISVVN
ncbi:MAG: aminotransferase class I/II-fold pyridoxal phosphate-dependent enzyme [Pseudobutyrivibrio sp.]|nr:aminotransferase class I/II-fold pyridoxal phosphate-dependent enzyme [Pseudobutyrivibrio sp.]